MTRDPVDVAIVGAGAAGLACAIELAEAGCQVRLFEAVAPGGQLMQFEKLYAAVAGFAELFAPDIAARLIERAVATGVEMCFESVEALHGAESGWSVVSRAATDRAGQVVVATGSRPITLDVPGSKELEGRGVSYCASCDGPLYRNDDVVVVGNTFVAAVEAEALARLGASVSVATASRSPIEALREVAARHDNVSIRSGWQLVQVDGVERVESVVVENVDSSERVRLRAAAVFGAVGQTHRDLAITYHDLAVTPPYVTDGELAVAGIPGLFAIGDARAGSSERLISAIADGMQAAGAVLRASGRPSAEA